MEARDIHLSDYIRIINKRHLMIILCSIIIFAITAIITFTMTPKYKATTKLLIENVKQDPLSQNKPDNRRDPEFLATQYQIIKSEAVARKVVKNLSLDTKYTDYFRKHLDGGGQNGSGTTDKITRLFNKIKEMFGLHAPADVSTAGNPGADRNLKEIITEFIVKNIEVNPVRTSRIVGISFSSDDPDLSRIIVNAIAKAYMDELLEIKLNIANYKLNWMKGKAEQSLEKLKHSENALQSYIQANNIVPLKGSISNTPQKLSELNSQLVLAETKRKKLETIYNQVRKEDIDNTLSIPSAATNNAFLSLKQSILEAEQNIMELSISKKYGRQHPAMIKARAKLEGLKKLQHREIKNILQTLKTDFELTRLNEENLQKSIDTAKAEEIQSNEKFIQYNILKREIETNRSLYDALITNLKEQRIISGIQTINVWVLERAKSPEFPYKPNVFLNLFLGLMLGIVSATGLAFFIEYIDITIKVPDEIESRLGLPLLGTVFLSRLKKKEMINSMIKNPNSAFSERYKAIRTSIMLTSADNKPKSLLITSGSAGDGKTITSVNLALAMVHFKHRVLLIDADLRNPQIHNLFGLDNTEGLSTYVAGVLNGDLVKPGPMPGLDIITSGPKPPNPSEIISSQRVRDMIGQMSQKYDMVLLDSAPSLYVTDSLILSKVVDGTVLVIRAGKTDYDMAQNCIKSLKDINARLIGIILNAINIKENGYYSYYGGYGTYGESPAESKK
ncbi:MAG: polysaccharide biosynthesis tyrosine autokinase [Deltaproteobacteria bacterium]|nr:polysaccharide biosynthesis tyrosine autokinase [Deltaproteobacteria bacterium]